MRQQFVTNESNTWTEDHRTTPHTHQHQGNYHHPSELLRVRNWARHRNLPVLPLLAALCSVSTHVLHAGRGSFYWHCLNCIVTVQGLSTLSLSSTQSSPHQRREAQKGELRTHEQCFSNAQHKNLIKIVPEW